MVEPLISFIFMICKKKNKHHPIAKLSSYSDGLVQRL